MKWDKEFITEAYYDNAECIGFMEWVDLKNFSLVDIFEKYLGVGIGWKLKSKSSRRVRVKLAPGRILIERVTKNPTNQKEEK